MNKEFSVEEHFRTDFLKKIVVDIQCSVSFSKEIQIYYIYIGQGNPSQHSHLEYHGQRGLVGYSP